jgi:foldase protein PrsA
MAATAINQPKSIAKLLSGRRLWLALAAVVLLAAGAWGLLARTGDGSRTVLVVDGRETSMDYFVKRVAMSGLEPLVVLKNLAYEDIMRQEAPNPPFQIELSDKDVDEFIRQSAAGRAGELPDADFREWLRQQLNETRLGEQEYRRYMATQLLYDRMTDVLARRLPTVAPQVRLSSIAGLSVETARSVERRLAAGERFEDLAAELNTMPKLQAAGGDIGWYTRDELDPVFAMQVFDILDIGEAGRPFQMTDGSFNIVQLTGRDPAREMGPVALETIRSGLLEKWLGEQFSRYEVRFRGLNGPYGSETDDWVRSRVGAMQQNSAGRP